MEIKRRVIVLVTGFYRNERFDGWVADAKDIGGEQDLSLSVLPDHTFCYCGRRTPFARQLGF